MASAAELMAWQADVIAAQASIAARQAQITQRTRVIDIQFPTWNRNVAYQIERRTVNWLSGHLAHLQKLAAVRGRYLSIQIPIIQGSGVSPAQQQTAPTASGSTSSPAVSPSTNTTPPILKTIGPPGIDYLFRQF